MGAFVVVILAAGQGTRMRSKLPKLLHPVCGRPMIGWPIAAARAAGATRIVVVDSPAGALAGTLPDDVAVAVQAEPRGTGDAVRAAEAHFDAAGTVVVLNGDVPLIAPETIAALVEAREGAGTAATIVTSELEDPTGYGRVVRAPDGDVERVVETKKPGDATPEQEAIREVNAGIYAFDAAPLAGALARVGTGNAQGEYYLPDVLAILRGDGGRITALRIADTAQTLGINDRVALAAVRAEAQRRISEALMYSGVTIVDPASTVIDVEVTVGQDTVVEPSTSLRGTTRVGSGSTVGPGATLIDTEVGDGAKVIHSYTTQALIGDRVSVGPFAYLRPGTVLRDGAKAGTFVEIKNSDIGEGTKVPHLSYIGDADVGPGTNLGAATITANYDGTHKHRTRIGAGVKTAVDTTLMAPVTIGDHAWTAAGSVVGQDVPDGALAGSPGVARSAQRNVEGYDDRRRGASADSGGAEAGTSTDSRKERP